MGTKDGNCGRRRLMSSCSRLQGTAEDGLFSSERFSLPPGRSLVRLWFWWTQLEVVPLSRKRLRLVVAPVCTWFLKSLSFLDVSMISSFRAYRTPQLCAKLAITGQFSKSGTWTPLREYYAWWSQDTLRVSRLDDKRIIVVRALQLYSHSRFNFYKFNIHNQLFVSGTVSLLAPELFF